LFFSRGPKGRAAVLFWVGSGSLGVAAALARAARLDRAGRALGIYDSHDLGDFLVEQTNNVCRRGRCNNLWARKFHPNPQMIRRLGQVRETTFNARRITQ
jgi:hypothetical protein